MVIRKQLEEGTLITKMITQAPSKYVQQTKPMAPAWETWGGYLGRWHPSYHDCSRYQIIKDSQRSVEPKIMKNSKKANCIKILLLLAYFAEQPAMTKLDDKTKTHTTSKSDFDMTWMEYKIRGIIRVWTTTTFIQHPSGVLSYYFYIKSTVWQWWS